MVEFPTHGKGQPLSNDGEGMQPHQRRYRWVMLALLSLLYGCFGLIGRALSPLVTPILRDLNISYTQMGIIFGSWQLTVILVAVVAGTVLDMWGIRRSIFVGALFMSLSAALRYFPHGFTSMLLVIILFGLGCPMISIGCPKTISLWFSGRSRGTAIGVYSTGSRVGGLVALAFTNSVVMPLTGYSWRLTFVYYGLFTFVAALLWWVLAEDVEPVAGSETERITEVFRKLIKVRNAQIALLMAFLAFATSHGFNNWLPKILETSGLSAARAGFGASIPIAASIPAILVIPRLVPPHERGRFIALASLLTVANIFGVFFASGALRIAGLILFGISTSFFLPMLILILMDDPQVDSKYMGSAGGLVFCAGEFGGFVGPSIMGALVDMTGTFLAGGVFLASMQLTIAAMTVLIKIPPPLPADSTR